ncbi:MAG: hypothetical protein WAN36_10855, partial [Calditrichia bacterium]
MRLVETFYGKSPVFLQNFLVSAYGLKLYSERYGGNFKKYYKDLIKTQRMKKDELANYQFKKLTNLLRHAYSNSAYYRKLFNQLGFDVSSFKDISSLKKLPILAKETIRMNKASITVKNFKPHQIINLNTSGTTGTSLSIPVDIDSRRKSYAFSRRRFNWAGLSDEKHGAVFGGRAIVPSIGYKNNFWRYNAVLDSYLFSSYHLSNENIPYYIKKLMQFKPRYIESYPSAVYTIAAYMQQNGISGVFPKAILTSAETLLDYQKEIIQQVFQCPVSDQYGCTEQAIFVSQCEKGIYHINPDYGIVEIVDENDEEVPPGKTGRVICTSFVNQALPLIRYDIGDFAVKGAFECSCGRSFPTMEKIIGRKDDFIITPDGRKIGRLD